MATLLLFTLAAGLAAPHADADFAKQRLDNWHHWRGPLVNGTAPKGDPPIEWDEQKNVKWKLAIPGRGTSTPIVWNDQIFLLTAIDTGKTAPADALPKTNSALEKRTKAPTTLYQFVVMSIDRRTGRIRWQQTATEQVPHEGHHPTHCYAAGSPMTDGRYLYLSFGSRGIYCYDLDGKLQWQRQLGRMETRLGWGEAVTPVIHGDALVVNWDQEQNSFLIVLDAKTGETKWKVERDEPTSWATPLVVDYRGKTQVIVNATKRTRSYDLQTGQLIWECGGQTVNVIPSPVLGEGVAYCMSGYKGAAAFAIPLDSTGDVTDSAKFPWRYHRGTPYVPSPLLLGNRLYFTQTNEPLLTCINTSTGKPVFERERLHDLGTLYSSPAAAANRIYICDREGNCVVLKNSDKLEVLATNKLGESIDASPVIVGKQLLLRGEKHLFCLEQ